MTSSSRARAATWRFLAVLAAAPVLVTAGPASPTPFRHVLLLSIDGFHAVDAANYAAANPNSAVARLARRGVSYTQTSTPVPSDSFPGLLALVTGGSPATTGVYYDDSYARELSPPGSACATVGTATVFDEAIDLDASALDGGGGIDASKLPLDPRRGCTPVYPHDFLRANTVFEVVHAAGGRTAWADKHLAYDLVNGPSGTGIADLYTPEIAAIGPTVDATFAYDDLKVDAVVREIEGRDHAGTSAAPVPALFGMNFQAVSIAQKDASGGYVDAAGTPSALLAAAFKHTDESLGRILAAIDAQGLTSTTLVILTAKHGQAPIDPALHRTQLKSAFLAAATGGNPDLVVHATMDDVALFWLKRPEDADAVAGRLRQLGAAAGVDRVLVGPQLALLFGDARLDPRVPDVVAVLAPGLVLTSPGATKVAEHGGFGADDTAVALIVAGGRVPAGRALRTPVTTMQVAPTILAALGLAPATLQAVKAEGTAVLPGLGL